MRIEAQIDFQGTEPSEHLRTIIEDDIARLEELYDRITACRVVVKAPSQRHRTGGLYEIHIHIVLPDGRDVVVERTPSTDERFSDPHFAVRDAFRRARRRLQDAVREMRGEVKAHETSPVGIVRRVNPDEGYGFIETADGREIYFHKNSVLSDAFAKLAPGVRVTFAEEAGEKGPQASTVSLLGKRGP
ncbi:cold shock domain-containing protein [Microvirga sp. 2MCAF38]|uniref:cold shock domain-containing protein n=1 Tax=Microvirga sp. 2MCAF38 TaxID=3232989 RepID=UPI003F9BB4C7